MRSRTALALLGGSASILLVTMHGCGSTRALVPSDDAGVVDVKDAREEWQRPPCVPPPRPDGVPDGWELLTDYEACCGFYAPTTPEQLPAPMKWTPCEPARDGGIACREILADWAVPETLGISAGRHIWVHDNNVTMMTTRTVLAGADHAEQWTYSLIADADGPVRQAFFQTRPKRCLAFSTDIRDGSYVYRVREFESSYNAGALAAKSITLGPVAFRKFQDGVAHEFTVGTPGVVNWTSSLSLYPWNAPDQGVVFGAPENEQGLQQVHPTMSGSTIFWQSSSLRETRIKIFTTSGGTRDFISFGGDISKGAADVGTDGKDIVWLEGAGATPSSPLGLYPVVSFMTSPYAEDPAKLTPRRLRSEIASGVGVSPAIVGCGYAARDIYSGLRIVRLSDGRSWFLPHQPQWTWMRPLGITCDELFTKFSRNAHPSVARIRLDSLGPGEPAD
jgi:hypothetical protein